MTRLRSCRLAPRSQKRLSSQLCFTRLTLVTVLSSLSYMFRRLNRISENSFIVWNGIHLLLLVPFYIKWYETTAGLPLGSSTCGKDANHFGNDLCEGTSTCLLLTGTSPIPSFKEKWKIYLLSRKNRLWLIIGVNSDLLYLIWESMSMNIRNHTFELRLKEWRCRWSSQKWTILEQL